MVKRHSIRRSRPWLIDVKLKTRSGEPAYRSRTFERTKAQAKKEAKSVRELYKKHGYRRGDYSVRVKPTVRCRVEHGLCMTHGFSVSPGVKCPQSPLTASEWRRRYHDA